MVLNLGSTSSLFPHNRDFDEGLNRRGVRPGQATIVVALDGSGDAEGIKEAIKMLPINGGVIYVKEGSYNLKSGSGGYNMNKPNINIIGAGAGTVITSAADTAVFIVAANNCSIKNLKIIGTDNAGDTLQVGILAQGSGRTGLIVEDCWITLMGNRGITLDADKCIVSNCLVDSNNDEGIVVSDNNNIVISNQVHSNTNEGIHVSSGDRNIISSNISLSNGTNFTDAGTNTTTGTNITA